MSDVLWSLATWVCLLPLAVLPFVAKTEARPAAVGVFGFWPPSWLWHVLALALAGPLAWSALHLSAAWSGSLTDTLWLSIAVCLVLYTGLCAFSPGGWRLAALLGPYAAWVGLVASLTAGRPGTGLQGGVPGPWLDLHIAGSVTTYALVTLAAVASLAAFIQQRALKTKRFNRLTRFLPSVADSDRLQLRLLMLSEVVLGVGLVTGMAVMRFEKGAFLRFDHKTLFSIATFVVIAGLLIMHTRVGLRGKIAARLVLMAYLLLTLAYPGVKFVTGVLME